ncbi:hypothetical protein D3C72_913300 [compost metagenome]
MIREARRFGVLASIGDGLFGSVDVGHVRASGGGGQAGHAGVAEQVQDLGLAQRADAGVHPLPVGRLLGEEGQVAERGEAAGEAHVAPFQREGVDGAVSVKAPAAGVLFFLLRIEDGGGALEGRRIARRPEALRLGPDDGVAAIALQLATMTAVQQRIVGPASRDEGFGRGRENGSHLRLIGAQAAARPASATKGSRNCADSSRAMSGRWAVLSQR